MEEKRKEEKIPYQRKKIEGFEDYEIDTNGVVWSLNYKNQKGKEAPLKPLGKQYPHVQLCKNGKIYNKRIHRLVAEAFLPNPNNLPFINHKDSNSQNYSLENLEWCNQSYNVRYGFERMRKDESLDKYGLLLRNIYCYDPKTGLLIKVYNNTKEVYEEFPNINNRSLGRMLHKARHLLTLGGFYWSLEKLTPEEVIKITKKRRPPAKPVFGYNVLTGEKEVEYRTIHFLRGARGKEYAPYGKPCFTKENIFF